MKKRLAAILLILAVAIGMVCAIIAYFDFVSQTIFDESVAHLNEIFHQA